MARSKTIRFYDIPLPLDLPEAQNWLHDYHHHCKVLADYMKAHGAGSSVCHSMNSCLTEFVNFSQIPTKNLIVKGNDSVSPYP